MDKTGVIQKERIILNVGGQRFQTFKATLESIPGTRISALNETDPNYYPQDHEFFFDRNPCLFPYILDGFREGEINFPLSTPASLIRNDLSFWGLEESNMSPSSLKICNDWDDQQKSNEFVKQTSTAGNDSVVGTRRIIWTFLAEPRSSIPAMVWCVFYTLMLVATVVVIAVGSLPSVSHSKEYVGPEIAIIFCILGCFFFLELAIRFSVHPRNLRALASFFNIIDILAIIPMFTIGVIDVANPLYWFDNDQISAHKFFVASICILRALRILKVGVLSQNILIVFLAAKASYKEFLFMILALLVGVAGFGTALFYAESGEGYNNFKSIPEAYWFCIVSMTTVGYGDFYPKTVGGRVLSAMCIITGLTTILMTGIPVFVNQVRRINSHVNPLSHCSKPCKTREIKPAKV